MLYKTYKCLLMAEHVYLINSNYCDQVQVKHDQIYFVRFPDPLKCKLWLLFDKGVRELDWIFPKTVSTHLTKFPMHFRAPVRDFLGGTDKRRDCEKRIV